jgi:NAD dependent epimerase/dehydratase family enzyme
LTKAIAEVLHKPLLFPKVPAFVLKLVLGEMANLVLNGSNVSADKILKTGFKFQYEDLKKALQDLLL